MGKKSVKNIFWGVICYILFTYVCLGGIIIIEIHRYVPFFPILFFFDLCFIVVYPLFLHFILKKRWFECAKDNYTKVKYILFPWFVMETCVMIYYYNQILLVFQKISDN